MPSLIERLRRGDGTRVVLFLAPIARHSFSSSLPTLTLTHARLGHSHTLITFFPPSSLTSSPPGVAASPNPTWRRRATRTPRSTSCRWRRQAGGRCSTGRSTWWTGSGTTPPSTSPLAALLVQLSLGSPPRPYPRPYQGGNRLATAPLIQGAPTSS